MTGQNQTKLKILEREVPEGLLVTSRWLEERGYFGSLRSYYVRAGWLEQPARGVFRRPRGPLKWEQVVISLQSLLGFPVMIGGRTAIEIQGYAHYVPFRRLEVHLYADRPLPGWMNKLPLEQTFVFRNRSRLFRNDPVAHGLTGLTWDACNSLRSLPDPLRGRFNAVPWGQWDRPLVASTLERAVLELLDELPDRESFDGADKLVEGLATLRPARLQKLLADCRSVKVKRLFFYFAERHRHAWLKHIDREAVDLGSGDRMLVRGGKFDPVHRITVPRDLDAV